MVEFLSQNVSYLGVFIALVLTGAGLPIPEEVIVILAGIASFEGTLNPWLALVCCLLGAIVGDCVMYWIGRHFGQKLLHGRSWYTRLLHAEREKTVERMIEKHGLKVFFVARFLVGLRSPVYMTAGILRVPFRRFLLIDLFSATVVVTLFFGLSYAFAAKILEWFKWIHQVEMGLTISIVTAVCAVVLYFFVRHRRRVARINARRVRQRLAQANRLQRRMDQTHSIG